MPFTSRKPFFHSTFSPLPSSPLAVGWTFVSPQPLDSHVENYPPCGGVGRWGPFVRRLGHEGGGLTSGINALRKEALEASLASSVMWDYNEKTAVEVGSHHRPNLLIPWTWTSQLLQLWKINCCYLWAAQSMVFCYSTPNRLRYQFLKMILILKIIIVKEWLFKQYQRFF